MEEAPAVGLRISCLARERKRRLKPVLRREGSVSYGTVEKRSSKSMERNRREFTTNFVAGCISEIGARCKHGSNDPAVVSLEAKGSGKLIDSARVRFAWN